MNTEINENYVLTDHELLQIDAARRSAFQMAMDAARRDADAFFERLRQGLENIGRSIKEGWDDMWGH